MFFLKFFRKQKFIPDFVILIILDGWGISPVKKGNAVKLANTPNFDFLEKYYPKTTLQAAGIAVGLPWGEQGNSEVGHLNLGAGKVIYQPLPRISRSIEQGTFFTNKIFKKAIHHRKKFNSKIHLVGLISTGGVHSHLEHLLALLELMALKGVKNIYIHGFTDGRDTPPKAAKRYIKEVKQKIKELQLHAKFASLSGRYFAMDRDRRWKRTEKAYRAMVFKTGRKAKNIEEAIDIAYKKNETDEFISPTVIDENGMISENDAVIFFNFRADRARQITKAFIDPSFKEFKTKKFKNLFFVCMTEYQKGLCKNIAFPEEKIALPLGKVISDAGFYQFHLAETEKYAHVTYFFNGYREKPFKKEKRTLIPSPKVPTYDKTPEMSAYQITETLLSEIKTKKYKFSIVNFANPDMVGHTGVLKAGIKACEVVDECLGKILKLVIEEKGAAVVTADHGNVEEMINLETGEIDKEHSTNPVPFVLITPFNKKLKPSNEKFDQIAPIGALADVAPTILALLNLNQPIEMTGYNLIESLR